MWPSLSLEIFQVLHCQFGDETHILEPVSKLIYLLYFLLILAPNPWSDMIPTCVCWSPSSLSFSVLYDRPSSWPGPGPWSSFSTKTDFLKSNATVMYIPRIP